MSEKWELLCLPVDGIDYHALRGNVKCQRTVKAQCQPQGVIGGGRNVEHAVQHRDEVIGVRSHSKLAHQVVILPFLFGLMLDEIKQVC